MQKFLHKGYSDKCSVTYSFTVLQVLKMGHTLRVPSLHNMTDATAFPHTRSTVTINTQGNKQQANCTTTHDPTQQRTINQHNRTQQRTIHQHNRT